MAKAQPPQIRYPDCYGIDMSRMRDFVAFVAAVELTKQKGDDSLLTRIYEACLQDENNPVQQSVNHVQKLFEPYTADEISKKIAQLLTPADMRADVEILYQSISGLHLACPDHRGDWYFTGNYPTPGGNRVANRSFINFIEKSNARAY